MKEIKINIPEGYEIDKSSSTFEKIVFKKKAIDLPNTWEEFCNKHLITEDECYISEASKLCALKDKDNNHLRGPYTDRNYLPNVKLAKAIRALCQLIQLRDCYRQGWKPDFNNDEHKYMIELQHNEFHIVTYKNLSYLFSFQTADLRDKFINNFRDLLEEVKELYM